MLKVRAVGTRVPAWVEAACDDYLRRCDRGLPLQLETISAASARRGADPVRAMAAEGEQLLSGVPAGAQVIALAVVGTAFDSPALAQRLEQWLGHGPAVFLIGGANGLSPHCLERAQVHWSLSALTLPHLLVRVVVLEQLYRAYSILRGLPYHLGH